MGKIKESEVLYKDHVELNLLLEKKKIIQAWSWVLRRQAARVLWWEKSHKVQGFGERPRGQKMVPVLHSSAMPIPGRKIGRLHE